MSYIKQQKRALQKVRSLYKKGIDNCEKRPRDGGYPIKKLKQIAESMGIDISIYNTRKNICKAIRNITPQQAIMIMLDLDRNKFITLKEYIAVEEALGPLAKSTVMYHYQDIGIQVFFLRELIRMKMVGSMLCIPPFLSFHNIYTMATIIVDVRGSIFFNRESMHDSISACMLTGKRFIMLGIAIHGIGKRQKHATMAIIDTVEKVIEHFDSIEIIPSLPQTQRSLNNFFATEFPDYVYEKLWNICQYMGPQIWADAWEGMCVTYAVMYLLLRVLNPNSSSRRIINYINSGSIKERISRIKKFHKYMEDTIKKIEQWSIEHPPPSSMIRLRPKI